MPKREKETSRQGWDSLQQSQRFLEWVNELGIEKTFLGRLIHFMEERFRIRRLSILFLFCLVLSLYLTVDFGFVDQDYREGAMTTSDIRAPMSLDFMDQIETERRRMDAELAVPPVFDEDPVAYEKLVSRVYLAFREMRAKLGRYGWTKNNTARVLQIKEFLQHQPQFEQILGGPSIPFRVFEWLVEQKFSPLIENEVIRALESRAGEKIIADLSNYAQLKTTSGIIRIDDPRLGESEYPVSISTLRDLGEVRKNVFPPGTHSESEASHLKGKLIQSLLIANVSLNQQETAIRRLKARENILPSMITIKKGQIIAPEGTIIGPYHLAILDKIKEINVGRNQDFRALMLAGLFVSMILVFFSYLRRFTLNKVLISIKDLSAMGTVTILIVSISKLLFFVSNEAFGSNLAIHIPQSAFLFLIPAAAGSMLVGLLITSGELVWLFTAFQAVVLSSIVDFNFSFLFVAFVGGIAGARGVFNCKRRNDIYKAGLRTGLVNALMIAFMTLLNEGAAYTTLTNLSWNIGAGFLSGIGSSLVAMMLIPLLETLFNYTTDVKLLELGNLDHPLLKEMIVKAPGTYHHSLVVGAMVEAAAEEIAANPLLAKVASYYHDIGKTPHSAYFIENQKPGQNPHDHLSPHMSRTILIAHVKDGVDLAFQHKLGKPIVDVILQHHGTTLIAFFYNKAKESQDESLHEVQEDDFRYPGPKPQFREAALCMLADSIEAAARSLDEPNPVRLQNIVKNIIHRKFTDGQLDECNLTLKELSTIERAFIRILLGIYHQRIDYPKQAGGGASEAAPTRNLSSV